MSSPLPEPFEYLDLAHGDSIRLRVDRWLDGTAVIHPRVPSARHVRQHMDQQGLTVAPPPGTPISVETPVLRLYGQRLDQTSPATYWDISSKTARADLLTRLQHSVPVPAVVTLTANGAAPKKRYSVEVYPAS